ncbi:unnamed protein product, partial [Prorocentrum cordatum]
MSAVLVQRAGFPVCFMSGFAVSASQLALPDAGLISFGEQLQVGRNICEATRGRLLVIGDGDTGFGGSGNVRRTMRSYAAAGFAGITIEDQVYPKRCSYARGLAVEGREAAVARVRAAVASRDEMRTEGLDLVLVARTDCRNASAGGGLQEAIERCRAFAALGADVVYAEGLAGAGELRQLSTALPDTPTMLAQVERPGVPLIGAAEAGALGFSLSLLGVTVFNCALHAMRQALREMAAGGHPPSSSRMPFEELYREVGFDEHYSWEARFEGSASSGAAPAASGAQPAGGGSWGALPPEEKRSLQAKLDRMGSEQLDRVLEFLGPDVGDGEDEGEVDLDVDRLAPDRQLALVRQACASPPLPPAQRLRGDVRERAWMTSSRGRCSGKNLAPDSARGHQGLQGSNTHVGATVAGMGAGAALELRASLAIQTVEAFAKDAEATAIGAGGSLALVVFGAADLTVAVWAVVEVAAVAVEDEALADERVLLDCGVKDSDALDFVIQAWRRLGRSPAASAVAVAKKASASAQELSDFQTDPPAQPAAALRAQGDISTAALLRAEVGLMCGRGVVAAISCVFATSAFKFMVLVIALLAVVGIHPRRVIFGPENLGPEMSGTAIVNLSDLTAAATEEPGGPALRRDGREAGTRDAGAESAQMVANREAFAAGQNAAVKVIAGAARISEDAASAAASQSYSFARLSSCISQARTSVDMGELEASALARQLARRRRPCDMAPAASRVQAALHLGAAADENPLVKALDRRCAQVPGARGEGASAPLALRRLSRWPARCAADAGAAASGRGGACDAALLLAASRLAATPAVCKMQSQGACLAGRFDQRRGARAPGGVPWQCPAPGREKPSQGDVAVLELTPERVRAVLALHRDMPAMSPALESSVGQQCLRVALSYPGWLMPAAWQSMPHGPQSSHGSVPAPSGTGEAQDARLLPLACDQQAFSRFASASADGDVVQQVKTSGAKAVRDYLAAEGSAGDSRLEGLALNWGEDDQLLLG